MQHLFASVRWLFDCYLHFTLNSRSRIVSVQCITADVNVKLQITNNSMPGVIYPTPISGKILGCFLCSRSIGLMLRSGKPWNTRIVDVLKPMRSRYFNVTDRRTERRLAVIIPRSATTFVSYWSTLVIQTVACSEVIYIRPTVNTVFIDKHCCSSGSHAAPPPFGIVFLHLYALLTTSLVLGLSSRLTCSQDICSRSTVHASDTLGSLARYKFVTYKFTYSA